MDGALGGVGAVVFRGVRRVLERVARERFGACVGGGAGGCLGSFPARVGPTGMGCGALRGILGDNAARFCRVGGARDARIVDPHKRA